MKKPQKKLNGRRAAYHRNMIIVEQWKREHVCSDCKRHYPVPAMQFAVPKHGPSIPVLAGSRCSTAVLEHALRNSIVLCANCKAIREA